MKILIAEDDKELAENLRRVLRAEHFAVDVAGQGEDAAHLGETEAYDCAVLDLGLPVMDGISVLHHWRSRARNFPVLILTARDAWIDKSAGFKAGADDYLTKPFLPQELVARIRALIRRGSSATYAPVRCGDLSYDVNSGAFCFRDEPLKLTAFEIRLLAALIMRKEVVVERSHLLESMYEQDAEAPVNSIEVLVGRLRRKIGPAMIETVRGLGYRLTAGER
jgi:DNA-binding response OmpR family regulator